MYRVCENTTMLWIKGSSEKCREYRDVLVTLNHDDWHKY